MSSGRKYWRHVTPDEAKLWKAVTKQFEPLKRSEPEVIVGESEIESGMAVPPKSRKADAPAKTPASNVNPIGRTNDPLAAFDQRRARRLASGRLPIDAKLDLHGLRQTEARNALLQFLYLAQASGFKHVKVITGKGGKSLEDEELRPFSLYDDNRRGILREQVPRWLGEAEFRRLVISFTVAGRGHGGGGALYVQVRKRSV